MISTKPRDVVARRQNRRLHDHRNDPSVGVVARDIENQFHSFNRPFLMLRLLDHYDRLDLRPLIYMASYLMLNTVGTILEADYSVEMDTGSAQGNPLSSLFAQFLFQPVLDKTREHFGEYDYILAMDRSHLRILRNMAPTDAKARAWARSASAEMHSSFQALRNICGMNCGIRVKLHERPAALDADIARIAELWNDGFSRFGGPWLAGSAFTGVDAFFAPVAFRAQSYGLSFGPAGDTYVKRMLEHRPMRDWYEAGLAETWREPGHEAELKQFGTWTADLRAG